MLLLTISEKELPENVEVSENKDYSIRNFAKIKDQIRAFLLKFWENIRTNTTKKFTVVLIR